MRVSTRSVPRSTSVNSSNCGVWPGSTQPDGLVMRATLTPGVAEFTRPTNSSIRFGLLPADWTIVGFSIRRAMSAQAAFSSALPPSKKKANSRMITNAIEAGTSQIEVQSWVTTSPAWRA